MVYIIKIYTDGSTKTNPGPGSYAVVMLDESPTYGISLPWMIKMEYENTTNNRMELMALIQAVRHSFVYACTPIIYCDSAYCVNMYNEWIDNWAAAGWKRSKNQPIENLDLVQELYELKHLTFFCPAVEKIKGHAGHIGNELCDVRDNTQLIWAVQQ